MTKKSEEAGRVRILYSSAVEITREFLKNADTTVSVSAVLKKIWWETEVDIHIYKQKKNRDIMKAIERLIAPNVKLAKVKSASKWAKKLRNRKNQLLCQYLSRLGNLIHQFMTLNPLIPALVS